MFKPKISRYLITYYYKNDRYSVLFVGSKSAVNFRVKLFRNNPMIRDVSFMELPPIHSDLSLPF
jgi:hypothetical protein